MPKPSTKRKRDDAKLWPAEVVTLALLFAIKGVGERAFYRWLRDNWQHLFPALPERPAAGRQRQAGQDEHRDEQQRHDGGRA